MRDFIRQNQKLATIIALSTVALVLVFNVLYFIFAPIQAQGNPASFVATPFIEQPNKPTPSPIVSQVGQNSTVSLISLSILLVIVILIIVIILALLKYAGSQRMARDQKRKQDLQRLAQAFEAYKQEHGQYPLSSTYQPQYYTGVNLSNDWNYYGLPNKEHMVRFLPDWPISDPSIDYNSKQQINQYIYYPKENGQKFFLYAHLEAPPKDSIVDYNAQDNLLRSWGAYNYRIASGQEQPLTPQEIPHPQHTKTPTPASIELNTPTEAPPTQSNPLPTPTASAVTAPTMVNNALRPRTEMALPIQPQPQESLAPSASTVDAQSFEQSTPELVAEQLASPALEVQPQAVTPMSNGDSATQIPPVPVQPAPLSVEPMLAANPVSSTPPQLPAQPMPSTQPESPIASMPSEENDGLNPSSPLNNS